MLLMTNWDGHLSVPTTPSVFDRWLANFVKVNPTVKQTQWYLRYVATYGFYDENRNSMVVLDDVEVRRILSQADKVVKELAA